MMRVTVSGEGTCAAPGGHRAASWAGVADTTIKSTFQDALGKIADRQRPGAELIYTVNMQVSCDVDDAYAIRRHAQSLIAPGVQGLDANKWIAEYTKTTEHCLAVILGSPEAAEALRAVGASVDGLEVTGVYVGVDQIHADEFDED
jgi:hypothetical protein